MMVREPMMTAPHFWIPATRMATVLMIFHLLARGIGKTARSNALNKIHPVITTIFSHLRHVPRMRLIVLARGLRILA
jgi:hypothetical protein